MVAERSIDELIKASRHGDGGAYSRLVEMHSNRVFAICYGILGHFNDAEDIAQETFIKGFSKIKTLRNRNMFSSWIAKIARNLCIDFLRRRRIKPGSLDELPENVANTAAVKPEILDLRAAIQRLPEDLRFPLVLYYFDGQDVHAIAEALGIGVPGVHTRLSRARRDLRHLLNGSEAKK